MEWGTAMSAATAAIGTSPVTNHYESALSDSKTAFDERVRLQIHGSPAIGVPFYVVTEDGRSFAGFTDAEGKLPRIATADEEQYVAYFYDEALARMDTGA